MIQSIAITDYFDLESVPIIDVRTPAEFSKGHIPSAYNVPLFSNEERVQVGTTYKQQSREEAILLGFDIAGPKWSGFIKDCLQITPHKRIAVHCWRGGMRSGAMAWALDLYGFKVYLIKGGYKNYRAWIRQHFENTYQLIVLGGMTGSGKTKLLNEMRIKNEQVIDFEGLAQHKGSAYGSMNSLVQPTQEQFENYLGHQLEKMDPSKRIWVEDECQMIGRCCIPLPIWQQMREAVLTDINIPYEERVHYLLGEYGVLDKNFLIECTERISKRLGPKETKDAIAAINENRMDEFIKIVLVYYDKQYHKGIDKRPKENIFSVAGTGTNDSKDADTLIAFSKTIHKENKPV